MAAPCSNWYEKLKVHPLCKQLKETNLQRTESGILNDAKSLIAVKNGDLFIWNSSSLNIIHCNLNSLLSEHEDAYTRFQVFMKYVGLNSCTKYYFFLYIQHVI